jgi:hypothetical protein
MDDGTIVLATTFPVWDNAGHGTQGFRHWLHPQSGLMLMRCSREAAQYFCRYGYFEAPPDLQDDDR